MHSFTPPATPKFYAGVDLHARNMFLVILDHDGRVRFVRNLPASGYNGSSAREVLYSADQWEQLKAG